MPDRWPSWRYDLLVNSAANVLVALGAYGLGRVTGIVPPVAWLDLIALIVLLVMLLTVAFRVYSDLYHQWRHGRDRSSKRVGLLLLLSAPLLGYIYRDEGSAVLGAVMILVAGTARLALDMLHYPSLRVRHRRLERNQRRRRAGLSRYRPVRSRLAGPRPRSLRR